MRYEKLSSAGLGGADVRAPVCALSAGGSVQDYRLYFLNRESRITRSEVVSVATDAEACVEGERLDHADAIEIWAGARKVAVIHPRGARNGE